MPSGRDAVLVLPAGMPAGTVEGNRSGASVLMTGIGCAMGSDRGLINTPSGLDALAVPFCPGVWKTGALGVVTTGGLNAVGNEGTGADGASLLAGVLIRTPRGRSPSGTDRGCRTGAAVVGVDGNIVVGRGAGVRDAGVRAGVLIRTPNGRGPSGSLVEVVFPSVAGIRSISVGIGLSNTPRGRDGAEPSSGTAAKMF